MSAHSTSAAVPRQFKIADEVRQNIDGQTAANHAVHDIRSGTAAQDLLLQRLQAVIVTGEQERLRAFMRTLQKLVERP